MKTTKAAKLLVVAVLTCASAFSAERANLPLENQCSTACSSARYSSDGLNKVDGMSVWYIVLGLIWSVQFFGL